MSLAIISVVYQNYTVLQEFIQSLEKQKDQDFHLFIADQSTDKQKIISKKIKISVINSKNLGYSHGINVCLKQAMSQGFTQFCVLNNDIYFSDDFIDKVILSLQKKPNSIIGGKIYYALGYEYHKERYTAKQLGKIIFYAGGTIDWDNILGKHIGLNEVDLGQYDQSKEINFATGCSIFLKSEVFRKIGFFDERYFLYLEDLDFSYRAAKTGIKIAYVPKAILWHKNARSSKVGGDLHDYYITRNRMLFGLSHGSIKTKAALVKESLRLVIRGRYWQKRGILDYYFNRLYQGSYVHQKSR